MKNEKHVITILNKTTNERKQIFLDEDEIAAFSVHSEVDGWEKAEMFFATDRMDFYKKLLENEKLEERLESIERTIRSIRFSVTILILMLIISHSPI